MIRFLPYLIELVLLVWCLVECIQTPASQVRNLDKTLWIILIILVPLVGCIAWLVAGRPVRTAGSQWRMGSGFPEAERPRTRYRRNEDDPAYMAEMARIDREHEESLKKWEAKLRAEEEQRRRDGGRGAGGGEA